VSTGGKLIALAVSGVMAVAIAALSRVPYTPGDPDDALVRIAWRYRSEPEAACRPITDEERARLPVHMQSDTICEGRSTPYRLQIALDGEMATDTLVSAAGARQDRPIYVFHEIPMAAGSHRIEVSFRPDGPDAPAARDGLSLVRTVELLPRHVALVTYDQAAGALVLRSP
jgi:hypothetical protein